MAYKRSIQIPTTLKEFAQISLEMPVADDYVQNNPFPSTSWMRASCDFD
jgi:hypothetical protein